MKRITSRRNAVVTRYREIAGSGGDLMLLDGAHLVEDALAAGLVLRHAIVAQEQLVRPDIQALLTRLERHEVELLVASPAVMAAASPVRSPSPIVALADRPPRAPDAPYRTALPLVVVACGVQDAGNLGAIVRVAEAGGASGLIAAGRCADPFGWKTLRGSMGGALRLPITRESDPQDAVVLARHRGCRIVATTPRQGRSLFDADLKGPLAILVGSEGEGLSDALLALAHDRVTIPMEPPVESLNTAVAAALVVYEARRQRMANAETARARAVRGHR